MPHLLKSMRNALYNNKELTISDSYVQEENLPCNKVYWAAIEAVVEFQKNTEWPFAPHLKPEYIKLSTWSKMNVRPAKAVLSKETAQAINILVKKFGKPKEWLTTAYFCACVSDWYDLMNNRSRAMAFSYKKMEIHEDFTAYLKFFMRFYSSMKLHPNQKTGLKPSQKGVLIVTCAILFLQKSLLDEGFEFVLTARFMNDCAENIFSLIRLRQRYPTCLYFERLLRGIALAQFMKKVKGSSYEDDEHVAFLVDLKSLSEYLEVQKVLQNESSEEEIPISSDPIRRIQQLTETEEDDTFYEKTKIDFDPKDGSFVYFCGYILKKTILGRSECKLVLNNCIGQWITKVINTENELYMMIDQREYKEGALTRPSLKAIEMFTIAEKVFRAHRDEWKNEKDVATKLTDRALRIIEDTYSSVKKCHLRIIIARFMRSRLHFYASFETRKELPKNAANIKSAANASKSTAAKQVFK